jgi:UDPglucose 6-dehydrogenase
MDAMFNTVSGKSICIWGFAFKKDTNDARESPAISVCKRLLEEQANIRIYDPQVSKSTICESLSIDEGDSRLTYCKSAKDAAIGTHVIALLTEWEEFKEIDYDDVYSSMQKPAHFFDGRNHIDPDVLKRTGFRLSRIGKV